MIDDLNRLPDDPFQVISEELAGYALAAMLFACWIADRCGWLT